MDSFILRISKFKTNDSSLKLRQTVRRTFKVTLSKCLLRKILLISLQEEGISLKNVSVSLLRTFVRNVS